MYHSKSHRFFASLSYHSTCYNSYFSFKKKNVDFKEIKNIIFPLCLPLHQPNYKLDVKPLIASVNHVRQFSNAQITIIGVGTSSRFNDKNYKPSKGNKILDHKNDSLVKEYSEKESIWKNQAQNLINQESEKVSIDPTKITLKLWHEYYNHPDFQTCSDLLYDVYHQENLEKYNLSKQFSENFRKAIDHGSMKHIKRSIKNKFSNQEQLNFKQQVFSHEIEECAIYILWLGGSETLINSQNLSQDEILKKYKSYDALIASHGMSDAMYALHRKISPRLELLPMFLFDFAEEPEKIQEQSKINTKEFYELKMQLKKVTQFLIENHIFSSEQAQLLNKF